MEVFTYHTYPDYVCSGGRLARSDWEGLGLARSICATVHYHPDCIILGVRDGNTWLKGFAPGGINCIGGSNV